MPSSMISRSRFVPQMRWLLAAVIVVLPSATAFADEKPFVDPGKRILFLGDSITHSGHYVAIIEARLRQVDPQRVPALINIGLSSETCSGLSEPDHPFPRPDVHERLDRALEKVKPDLVVACYGMNDGIYHPFSKERFAAYKRGVDRLIEKVHASGARLVLLTPPPFDPVPLRNTKKLRPAGAEKYAWFGAYEDYDDVLERYGKWILQQGDRVEMVIDVHGPITEYLAERRKSDPQFTLQKDGIHPNQEGHRIMARAILEAWKLGDGSEVPEDLLELVAKRQRLLHDAWLTHVGHKRPGVKAGLPLDEAEAKAKEIDAEIAKLPVEGN